MPTKPLRKSSRASTGKAVSNATTKTTRKPTPPKTGVAKSADLLSFENAIHAAPVPTSTRERILHAAVTLLHDSGFAALTQQRVCERAGVRQSHLTYYFPTRNDLLRETAVFGCEILLQEAVHDAEAGALTLDAIRNRFFIADESDRRFGRLMTALIVASDEDASIKPWLASFEVENRKKLHAIFHAVNAPVSEEDIELLHAAYVGAIVLDLGEQSDASLERAQRIVHRVLDTITAQYRMPEEPRQIRRSKASSVGSVKTKSRKSHVKK
jgi:AcrR family transcriptional regulator